MPAATATIDALLEADERRVARDSYRDAGGSKRRPLKSFLTKAEKRQAREEHAERLREAVAELREPLGFERWIETLELNPQLTPMNAALVALQTPGEIVGTSAQWNRNGCKIRKGETAAGRLTGKGFWPVAYFTTEQAGAGALEEFEPDLPDPGILEALRVELLSRLDRGDKARDVLPAIAELRDDPPPPLPQDPEFVQSAPEPAADLFALDVDTPESEPERPPLSPEERLEAIVERRARLAREREECDRELIDLATERAVPVSRIAERIGVSRQAIYQLCEP